MSAREKCQRFLKKEDRSKEEWHPSAKDQESAAKILFLCGFWLEWHDEMLE